MAYRLPKQAWLQSYFRIKSKTSIAKSEDFLDSIWFFFAILSEIGKMDPYGYKKEVIGETETGSQKAAY